MRISLSLASNICAIGLDERGRTVALQNKTIIFVGFAIAPEARTRPVEAESVFVVVGALSVGGDLYVNNEA